MPRGGKREGAGRKPNDPNAPLAETARDYLAKQFQKQEKALVDQYLKLGIEGDKVALKFLFEHAYGRAGTKDVSAPPTQIILQHAVPRPPGSPGYKSAPAAAAPEPIAPLELEEEEELDEQITLSIPLLDADSVDEEDEGEPDAD